MKLKVYHAQLRTLPAKRPSGVLAISGVVLKIAGVGDRRMYFSGSNDDANYAYIRHNNKIVNISLNQYNMIWRYIEKVAIDRGVVEFIRYN